MSASLTQPTAGQAVPVSSYFGSLGVDAQYGGPGYNDVNAEISSLRYIFVSHVRQGMQVFDPRNVTLGNAGIQDDTSLTVNGRDAATLGPALSALNQQQAASPGSVYSVETPNEINDPNNGYTLNGVSLAISGAVARQAQQMLWNAVQADPTLSGVVVLGPSISEGVPNWQQYVSQIGDLSGLADETSSHTYGVTMLPFVPLSSDLKNVQEKEGNLFRSTTETGASDQLGYTEQQKAIYDEDATFDSYRLGADKIYLYSLYSNGSGNWGLFQADGSTPNPAAVALHNTGEILQDTGANAATFAPSSLSYTLTGMTPTMTDLLFEKSDGTFDLVVYDEPATDQWGSGATNVTLHLATAANVQVFNPIASGTTPDVTQAGVSAVTIGIPNSPIIFQIGNGSAVPPGGIAGANTPPLWQPPTLPRSCCQGTRPRRLRSPQARLYRLLRSWHGSALP